MIALKEYQEEAVQELLKKTFEYLSEDGRQISLLYKAPTGSGKTVTMASFLSRFVTEVSLRPNLSRSYAFIWLAPNTLHLQSYKSLKYFYEEMRDLRTIQLDDLTSNTILYNKDLLFVNWSSVDKDKNTFRKENEQDYNLTSLVENTKNNGTEIIVIIDEAHLSAFTGEQARAVLNLIDAKIIISITATPTAMIQPAHQITTGRRRVVEAQMIKKGMRVNEDISAEEHNGERVDQFLVSKAIKKRDEIAEEYRRLGIDINPLLLIQLPSNTATLSPLDKSKKEDIMFYLEKEHNITTNNGLLSVWLSDNKDKINLDDLEKPNAVQKVLIFKQAITQGWDCPRAAVLIILREIGNVNFGIQTVGRILRMPEQKHYNNELLDYGHAYTNIQTNMIVFEADDLDYFNTNIAKRKEHLTFSKMMSSTIVNDRQSPGYLLSNFKALFFKLIEETYDIEQLPELDLFIEVDDKYQSLLVNNRAKLIAKFWDLDVDNINIQIPTHIKVDDYDYRSILDVSKNQEKFSKNQVELTEMLDAFCYNSITQLNKSKSWKTLKSTLLEFVEYYIGFDEYKAKKIILHSPNRKIISELIVLALEKYDVWLKERGNKNKRVENYEWVVPSIRVYSDVYKRRRGIDYHALDPYYEYERASNPEKEFVTLLENNSQFIEWWYKNGDKGREHFAIHYKNLSNQISLFYIDFVVKFKSGVVALFDTKTTGSDNEAVNKHNALIDYVLSENKTQKRKFKLVGSLTIPFYSGNDCHFRYYTDKIISTDSLNGWSFIDFSKF